MTSIDTTSLWREMSAAPEALATTLDRADGHSELAALLSRPSVRRIVAIGNGASWYAALAPWLASLESPLPVEFVTVSAGQVAKGRFPWRAGDVPLAISSSGSLRDIVEAVEDPGCPQPFGLITADDASPLGRVAGARALVTVRSQEAVTHTQAYLGAALVALDLVGRLSGDGSLCSAVSRVPELLDARVAEAPVWAEEIAESVPIPRAAQAFGSVHAWPAALEASLLFKEVAMIPAEGMETREGATSGMYALSDEQLVLVLPLGDDRLADEAASVCLSRGAIVHKVPWQPACDERCAAAAHFAHPLALATMLALRQGIDPDHPAWLAAYEATARSSDLPQTAASPSASPQSVEEDPAPSKSAVQRESRA